MVLDESPNIWSLGSPQIYVAGVGGLSMGCQMGISWNRTNVTQLSCEPQQMSLPGSWTHSLNELHTMIDMEEERHKWLVNMVTTSRL